MRDVSGKLFDESLKAMGGEVPGGIGEGASAEPFEVEFALDLGKGAEVFEGAQAADGGIEKSQQTSDEDLVVMEDAIGMGLGVVEDVEMAVEGLEVFPSDDLFEDGLGAFGPSAFGYHDRRRCRPGGRGQRLIGRHAQGRESRWISDG